MDWQHTQYGRFTIEDGIIPDELPDLTKWPL